MGILFLLKRKYRKAPLAAHFFPFFYLKILAGIAYGYLYIIYYGGIGDSLNFFQDGAILSHFAYEHPFAYLEILFLNRYYLLPEFHTGDLWGQLRAFRIVKLISVLNLFTGNQYWLGSIYLSFFSFLALWKLANALSTYFPRTYYAALIGILYFPSVLFFGSGLHKESLVIALLTLSLSYYLDYRFSEIRGLRNWVKVLGLWVISIWLVWQIKFYYLAALLPCLLAYELTTRIFEIFKPKKIKFLLPYIPAGLYILFFLNLFLLSFFVTFLHPKLALDYILDAIVYNHNISYIFSEPQDLIHYSIFCAQGYITLHIDLCNMLYNAPRALFAALFRPFIWEADNKLKLFVSLENAYILFSTFYALGYLYLKPLKTENKVKYLNLLLLAALTYVCILYTLLALASPNMGSLARYKIGGSPILIYLISIPFSFYLYQRIPLPAKKPSS